MKQLDKILQILVLNGTLTEQPGLFYGKTGVAVFFFHYAKQTGNQLFKNYAMDLIDEVQKQIVYMTDARYDIGLAGIGVGFEYFFQNGFIEAEDNTFFDDLDAHMYHTAMYEPYPNLNIDGGLTGLGRYFIYRLRGNRHNGCKLNEALAYIINEISYKIIQNKVSKNEQPDVFRFLYDLVALLDRTDKNYNLLQMCKEWNSISKPNIKKIFPYMNNLQRLYLCQNYFNKNLSKKIEQEWEKWEESNNNSLISMGLLNGWTSKGLLSLTSISKGNTSWLNLL